VGLVWTLTDDLSLEGRLRAQQSQLRVSSGDISPGACVGTCPAGRLRALSFEGQLALTSVGRINPYFLVGLGVVRTTVDAARIERGNAPQLAEVDVTDAGGDIGFGATLRTVGDLFLTAEMRATGSLPGGKDNAVTTFPFTLGLSYTIGGE
jgi:opacity protein-like surface antigen